MADDVPMARALSPLLIMGSPRSGTTFLAHMVNRFLDIRVSRDNGTLMRYSRLVRHYEPLSNDANLRRLIGHLYDDHYFRERLVGRGLKTSPDELFNRVRTRTYAGLVEAIFSEISSGKGKATWGYKRASLAKMTGEGVADLFPTAKFVHIIRDGRDVVLSMGRASQTLLERSWHFGATDWVSHVERGRSIGLRLGKTTYLEVRYEELMKAPADVLIRMLDFCGGGADRDARADRIRSEIPTLIKGNNTEKWRRLMPPDGVRQIERVAGPLLADLGYPLMFPDVAGTRVGLGELTYLHAQRLLRNLTKAPLRGLLRYRLEVLKGQRKARLR